jgi:hypothetical protein
MRIKSSNTSDGKDARMKVKRSLTYFKVPRACPWVSTYRFLRIGTIEERRKKEKGRNFTDLLNYARKRYSLFGSPDKIFLVPKDLRPHPKN